MMLETGGSRGEVQEKHGKALPPNSTGTAMELVPYFCLLAAYCKPTVLGGNILGDLNQATQDTW